MYGFIHVLLTLIAIVLVWISSVTAAKFRLLFGYFLSFFFITSLFFGALRRPPPFLGVNN